MFNFFTFFSPAPRPVETSDNEPFTADRSCLPELETLLPAWIERCRYHERNIKDILRNRTSLIQQGYDYPEDQVVNTEQPIASGFHNRKRAEENLPEQTKQLTLLDYDTQFYAELRAWQHGYLALTYIKRTQIFLSFQKHTNTPSLTHRIIAGAMLADLRAMGSSPRPLVRPTPKPDDKARILDRRVQFDEPEMAKVVANQSQHYQDLTRELCDQMRAKLPALPYFLSREFLANLERDLPCIPEIIPE